MDYCGPLGIPLSRFLSWSELDQGAALAWQVRTVTARFDECGACGQPRSEWLDENGKELRHPPFELVEVYCPACAALERHRQGRDEKAHRPGVHEAFRRVPVR